MAYLDCCVWIWTVFVTSCLCILVHRPLPAKSQACCWSYPRPSCFCYWLVRILSEPGWRKLWTYSSLTEGIVIIIIHHIEFNIIALRSALTCDRYFDFMPFVWLWSSKSVSSRENGADSILELGLLEAPEKAQVNETFISTPDSPIKKVNSELTVPASHFVYFWFE